MKFKEQPLQSFRLRNFKAVRDSGVVKFSPLTVFIGNNGTGKSSLIEGLETLQRIAVDGLDQALGRWGGFENVLNRAAIHKPVAGVGGDAYLTNPIGFDLRGFGPGDSSGKIPGRISMTVSSDPGFNKPFILKESIRNAFLVEVDRTGAKVAINCQPLRKLELPQVKVGTPPGTSFPVPDVSRMIAANVSADAPANVERLIEILTRGNRPSLVEGWQFLCLDPMKVGQPQPQGRSGVPGKMTPDGSNLGDYLLNMIRTDEGSQALNGIVETLRYVLPYARDVQPTITSEIQRTVYLKLTEQKFEVPGWLLSTGTLRLLALLAVLRHPKPPSVLFVEEIENGLDPRTVRLVMDEITEATSSGRLQVVLTTHSPHLLNFVPVSSVIVVEREGDGQPTFTRMGEEKLGGWAQAYTAGDLYLKGQLRNRGKKVVE